MTQKPEILFPEALLNDFIQLNSELSDNAFLMGDLAQKVADEFGFYFEHADILRALADQAQIDYNTLRDRERVSRAVPVEARLDRPLSYHQWRACVRKGTDPLPIADWALTGGKNHGIATVEEIRAHVYGYGDDPAWIKGLEKIKEQADKLLDYDELPACYIELMIQVSAIDITPVP